MKLLFKLIKYLTNFILRCINKFNIYTLSLLILTSCELTQDDKDETFQLLIREWVYSEILFNGYIMKPENYGFDYMSMEFKDDGTYLVKRDEEYETGEWMLDGNELVSAIGTPNEGRVTIQLLTKDSLVVHTIREQGEFEFIMLDKAYWESLF